jgi:hypothetical protein
LSPVIVVLFFTCFQSHTFVHSHHEAKNMTRISLSLSLPFLPPFFSPRSSSVARTRTRTLTHAFSIRSIHLSHFSPIPLPVLFHCGLISLEVQEAAANVVLRAMATIKEVDLQKTVDSLSETELDSALKYV